VTATRRWWLAGLAALACGGCAGTAEPEQRSPAPPTTAQLSRFAAETREPAYWLGPRFDGISVTHAGVERGRVGLTYGPWSCDSGCVDNGGVWTGPRETDAIARFDYSNTDVDPADCWTRVRRAVAVLLGCDPNGYPQELVIYSGTREIVVTSLYTDGGRDETSVRTVVRRLKPLNAHAPWPLLRPEPLTCKELRRVDSRYRRAMPRPLRPRARC
jgi:hypothetical protein